LAHRASAAASPSEPSRRRRVCASSGIVGVNIADEVVGPSQVGPRKGCRRTIFSTAIAIDGNSTVLLVAMPGTLTTFDYSPSTRKVWRSERRAVEPTIPFTKSRRRIAFTKAGTTPNWACNRRNGVRRGSCTAAILSRSCPLWVKSRHQRSQLDALVVKRSGKYAVKKHGIYPFLKLDRPRALFQPAAGACCSSAGSGRIPWKERQGRRRSRHGRLRRQPGAAEPQYLVNPVIIGTDDHQRLPLCRNAFLAVGPLTKS